MFETMMFAYDLGMFQLNVITLENELTFLVWCQLIKILQLINIKIWLLINISRLNSSWFFQHLTNNLNLRIACKFLNKIRIRLESKANIGSFSPLTAENTRAAYPIEYIPNAKLPCVGPHPKNVILLACDAFGVLPPVSKLSLAQTMYHFISGYTALVMTLQLTYTHFFIPITPQYLLIFFLMNDQRWLVLKMV